MKVKKKSESRAKARPRKRSASLREASDKAAVRKPKRTARTSSPRDRWWPPHYVNVQTLAHRAMHLVPRAPRLSEKSREWFSRIFEALTWALADPWDDGAVDVRKKAAIQAMADAARAYLHSNRTGGGRQSRSRSSNGFVPTRAEFVRHLVALARRTNFAYDATRGDWIGMELGFTGRFIFGEGRAKAAAEAADAAALRTTNDPERIVRAALRAFGVKRPDSVVRSAMGDSRK